MVVLTDVLIIEIGDTKIKQNIQDKWKTENCIIESILFRAHNDLDIPVDTEDPVGFYEEVQ